LRIKISKLGEGLGLKKVIITCFMLFLFIPYSFAENLSLGIENEIIFNDDKAPIIDANGYALVPLEKTLEAIGAGLEWNHESQTALIKFNEIRLQVAIEQSYLLKNGKRVEMNTIAQKIDDVMYVPIRPIVEALNGDLSWDGKNRVINISFKTDFERRVYELMGLEYNNSYALKESKELIVGNWKPSQYAIFTQYKIHSDYLNSIEFISNEDSYMTYSNYSNFSDGTYDSYRGFIENDRIIVYEEDGTSYYLDNQSQTNHFKLVLTGSNTCKMVDVDTNSDSVNSEYCILGQYKFVDENTLVMKFVFEGEDAVSYGENAEKVTGVIIQKRIVNRLDELN